MNNTMKILALVLVLLAPFVAAEELTENQIANQTLQEAQEEFQQLTNAHLPREKASDLYSSAEEIFLTQVAIEAEGGNGTYDRVYELLDTLTETREETFAVADELAVLKDFLDAESANTAVDFDPAYKLYEDAQLEFGDERFTKARDLIDQTYEKVSELNAASTKAQALYAATTDKIAEFFKRTWKLLLIEAAVIIVLFFLFRKTIQYQRVKVKINRLNKERAVIDDLIKQTQKSYFEEATTSESDYHIRMKKYGELIRDLNRQIPLLQEELVLLKVKK